MRDRKRVGGTPDNWREMSREQLKACFREEWSAIGWDRDARDADPELDGLDRDEAAAMIARRLRERLCWDPTLDPLEARALIAMAEGRDTDTDRLLNIIARRNCVGLTVIRATKKSQSSGGT